MGIILNEENNLYHNMGVNAVESSVGSVSIDEVV